MRGSGDHGPIRGSPFGAKMAQCNGKPPRRQPPWQIPCSVSPHGHRPKEFPCNPGNLCSISGLAMTQTTLPVPPVRPLWWGKSSETDALLASRFGELAARAAANGRARPLGGRSRRAPGPHPAAGPAAAKPSPPHPPPSPRDDKARALCLNHPRGRQGLSPLAGSSSICPRARGSRAAGQKRRPVRGPGRRAGHRPGPDHLRRLCRLCPPPPGDRRSLWPLPHRNAILGRASTEEEAAFLQQPGSGF